jgi:hypothetical protein
MLLLEKGHVKRGTGHGKSVQLDLDHNRPGSLVDRRDSRAPCPVPRFINYFTVAPRSPQK